jgi:tRNA(fMet)-specific endonuclease VapC
VSLYAFDTDTLTLFGRMHPAVVRNVVHHLADDVRTTAVTVEEHVGGWYTAVRNARLTDAVRHLASWDVLPFSVAAVGRFQDLLRQRLNVGGNDLRIAAIALEEGAVVVTRNLRDFRRVPGLRCEDWSI